VRSHVDDWAPDFAQDGQLEDLNDVQGGSMDDEVVEVPQSGSTPPLKPGSEEFAD